MPVCEMATHGWGSTLYAGDNENGVEFGFTGEMLEVALHSKIVAYADLRPGRFGWIDGR